jgi:hypothetical protein
MPAFPSANPAALRAQLDTQVDFLTQLSRHAFDTLGQISELNVQATRQLIDDTIALGRALSSCSDPFQMAAAAMRGVQPMAEHLRSWQGSFMGLFATGSATLAHDANDGSWRASRGGA